MRNLWKIKRFFLTNLEFSPMQGWCPPHPLRIHVLYNMDFSLFFFTFYALIFVFYLLVFVFSVEGKTAYFMERNALVCALSAKYVAENTSDPKAAI